MMQNTIYALSLAEAGYKRKERDDSDDDERGNIAAGNDKDA